MLLPSISFACTYVCGYAQTFLKNTSIHCVLDVEPEMSSDTFELPLRRNLLLAVKEALNNAVKHANARCIDVELEVSPSKARLTIEDDGIGMRPELEVSAGLGLRTMRYRASLIGARFSIGPAEPYGTLITCEWLQA